MPYKNRSLQELVSSRTRRRIMTGVSAGHFLVLVLVLTFSVVSEWLDQPPETITVEFYDPTLTNVVENPSPDPDPNNPIPPSGTPDGGNAPETPAPEEPQAAEPEPPKQLQPDPVESVAQPTVTQRKLPRKASKPKQVVPSRAKAVKQPKVTRRKRPGRNKNKSNPVAQSGRKNTPNATGKGKPGPRGSNLEPGHTAPGGQRGNSGYDRLVAGMIHRMWVTPDVNRLGGRNPQVNIEVIIAPDGRVVGKRITHRSGVLAMDESIQNLLDNLHRVIVPFDRKQHILRFAMRAE